ncbi:MAG: hypothetical protein DI536_26015 [Archangium gephyra]|uniref:Uncharacterized protein n=1 Tax=Archangium gephyra TaxID=48 RepID=A0A2W5SZ59_9BACT|nr:MAG: hypothetical protein DI536_26015 [Archangium gephyra]
MISALVLSLFLTQADAGAADAGVAESLPLPTFTPRIDAFGEFAARMPTAGPALPVFSVPRVQVGIDANWLGASGRVLAEGAYATNGGALIGVQGDSVVLRLREAWGGYQWRFLEARLGLIPTLLIPEMERGFRFRELTPDGLEQHRLLAPADFGGILRVHLPASYGWVGAAVTNGEGYTSRELNPGKNVDVTALIRPLAALDIPLEVLGVASFGTSGLPEVPTTRAGGGVQYSAQHFGAGVNAFWAKGLLADPTREGVLAQGFVRGTLFEHLQLVARAQWFQRSLTAEDAVFEGLVGVGGSVFFIEGFVAWVRTLTLGAARAALPGVDAHEVRVVMRLRWPQWTP